MWRTFSLAAIHQKIRGKDWLCSQLRKAQSTLVYEEIVASPSSPPKAPPAYGFVVHGLLGAGKNWRSFSHQLAKLASEQGAREWRIFLVDLRNHGKSSELTGFPPPHSMEAAARDLMALAKGIGIVPDIIAGHSMGGKVVMEFTRLSGITENRISPPKQVWVLDSQPGIVPANLSATSDVDKVLKEVQALPETVPSREWLYGHMESRGFSLGLAQWLGSSLVGAPAGPLRWMFNPTAAMEMYESYKSTDCFPLLRAPPAGSNIHVVRAVKSDRWHPELIKELDDAIPHANGESSSVRIHVLENAGHWLHVDNPKGLLKMMLPSMV